MKDLDVELDSKFDEKMFKMERFGWALMFLLLLASGIGLLGQSKLMWREAQAGELIAHYPRFVRKEAPTEIKFEVANAKELQSVWISLEYIEKFKVESVNPVPDEVVSRSNGIEYRFKTRGGHFQAIVEMIPQDFGTINGEFSAGDTGLERIQQFSYF